MTTNPPFPGSEPLPGEPNRGPSSADPSTSIPMAPAPTGPPIAPPAPGMAGPPMSQSPGAYGSVPSAPGGYEPGSTPTTKKPGIAGIVTGSILMGIAIIVTPIVAFAMVMVSAAGLMDSMNSFTGNQAITVTLNEGDQKAIYALAGYHGEGSCGATGPDGSKVDSQSPTVDTSLMDGETSWDEIVRFTAPETGEYEVSCMDVDLFAKFGLADSIESMGSSAMSALIPIMVGIVLFIGGLVLLIVTVVRRNQWKKANPGC